jgi:hypothetical protein
MPELFPEIEVRADHAEAIAHGPIVVTKAEDLETSVEVHLGALHHIADTDPVVEVAKEMKG